MRYMATPNAREGLIKKHDPSKEEIDSYTTTGSYSIWDFFVPPFQFPHHVERISVLGDGSSGKCMWYGAQSRARKTRNLLVRHQRRGHCSRPRYWSACQVVKRKVWPEIENTPNMKERAHFFPWALGGCSAHGTDNLPKYYTLDALMQPNGATHSSTCTRSTSSVPSLTH
ncbi:hypothetical protein EDB85DRAFT_1620323 [Lactarius pseudohatsudake]|nr:hypothetical protein EDB85DRAFT_1620323 [Lactarius pseudohatsudake]